jgi:hypothetical protein
MGSTTTANAKGVYANRFLRGRFPVKAATRIDEGNLVVMITTTGYVEGGEPLANGRCLGWAMELADNSAGSAGDKTVGVSAEPRGFAGKAGDLPVAANVGGTVYVDTSLSVKATAGSNSIGVKLLAIAMSGTQYVCEPL